MAKQIWLYDNVTRPQPGWAVLRSATSELGERDAHVPVEEPEREIQPHGTIQRRCRVRIEVLTIPDCPNGQVSIERVHAAVIGAGARNVTVEATIVSDVEDAETFGMHGSPSILIDGRDPFAEQGTVPSLSCRLYRTEDGLQGCPTVTEMIEVIRAADGV